MGSTVVFIGAGSAIFTRDLVRDLLTYPALADSRIRLVDIDARRLGLAEQAVRKIIAEGGYSHATVEATTDRIPALKQADAVICTIQVGGERELRADLEVPKRYGVNLYIGDTRGPAGVFRFLRTATVISEIIDDMEKICPEAIFLNYTNPTSMLSALLQQRSKVRSVGLCHSVQRTAAMLAGWIGAPLDEITYTCAGVNHQAWYLDFKWHGEDAYPLIRQAIEMPEIGRKELVRNEMFRCLGYYVTESSGHNSEYNWWYRKRSDLLERYCLSGTGDHPGEPFLVLREMEPGQNWRDSAYAEFLNAPAELARGDEFAAGIINAVCGDQKPLQFYANMLNNGLIDNLPARSCVEVPTVASPEGFAARHVGPLPDQLAILNGVNAGSEVLAIDGWLAKDSEKVFQAIAFDPLTAATLGLAETRDMVRDMFTAARDWLPEYAPLS